jgi:hypothetical protein
MADECYFSRGLTNILKWTDLERGRMNKSCSIKLSKLLNGCHHHSFQYFQVEDERGSKSLQRDGELIFFFHEWTLRSLFVTNSSSGNFHFRWSRIENVGSTFDGIDTLYSMRFLPYSTCPHTVLSSTVLGLSVHHKYRWY